MPYVLPTPQARPGWGDYAGQGLQQGTDLLLQALMSGQLGLQQRGPAGAPPGVQGPPMQNGGFSGQPPSIPQRLMGMIPQVVPGPARQAQQLQVQQAQQDLKMGPLKQQKMESEISRDKAYADWLRSSGMVPGVDPATGQPQPTAQRGAAATPGQSPAAATAPPKTMTEQYLSPTEVMPGQVALESVGRTLGRKGRLRETATGLEESYSSKTASAAKGFSDTGNIAVAEREMMSNSFPKDNDSFEGRVTKERSINDFFEKKEAHLLEILARPIPQIMKGVSRHGPRYEADPSALAARKSAQQDLDHLRATRVQYQQMYEEAAQKMPPIGATSTGETADPNVAQLQQQFPGAKITKVK